MHKNRLFFIVYIISIIVLSFSIHIRESKADVLPVDYAGAGSFLPEVNVPFNMTNASVVFTIGAHAYRSRFDITFEGNYTIYNPTESTVLTLAAPFSSEFKDLELSCVIKIDTNLIPFQIIEYTHEELSGSLWNQYISGIYGSTRKFIIINATFPENDSITITYHFNAYISNPANQGNYQIFYDVGTSRVWNGPITERVEFKVFGKRPDSYQPDKTDTSEYNLTISDIEDGISYVWGWENEIINEHLVYISYSYSNIWLYYLGKAVPFLLIGGFFALVIIVLYKYSKRRKIRPDFNDNSN